MNRNTLNTLIEVLDMIGQEYEIKEIGECSFSSNRGFFRRIARMSKNEEKVVLRGIKINNLCFIERVITENKSDKIILVPATEREFSNPTLWIRREII